MSVKSLLNSIRKQTGSSSLSFIMSDKYLKHCIYITENSINNFKREK